MGIKGKKRNLTFLGSVATVDEFLPILVFVVIHSNPPKLLSNMEFISSYR
jgi:hypothetical protein